LRSQGPEVGRIDPVVVAFARPEIRRAEPSGADQPADRPAVHLGLARGLSFGQQHVVAPAIRVV
jgi:hypothetical protein